MAIMAINVFPHPTNKNIVKVGRIVTLPHWQGYNLGMRLCESVIEKYYKHKDVRLTTTLSIVHNYLHNSPDWGLKYQGIRKNSDSGKNANSSKNVREVYMETYQYINDLYVDEPIKRVRCPNDKVKGQNYY